MKPKGSGYFVSRRAVENRRLQVLFSMKVNEVKALGGEMGTPQRISMSSLNRCSYLLLIYGFNPDPRIRYSIICFINSWRKRWLLRTE